MGSSLFEEIMNEKFPNLGKLLGIQFHKGNRIHFHLNAKRHSPRHITRKSIIGKESYWYPEGKIT